MDEKQKNILFVKAIEKYPCLYNRDMPDYTCRDRTGEAWKKVSKEVGQTPQQCRTRWKNLRTVFVRQTRVALTKKSTRKYYLYKYMKFLIPYISNRNQAAGGDVIWEQTVESDDDIINEYIQEEGADDVQFESSDIKEEDTSNDPIELDADEAENLLQMTMCEGDQNIQTKVQTNGSSGDMGANKMFLLSLLPDLEMMTPSQIRKFKRKVLDTVDELLTE